MKKNIFSGVPVRLDIWLNAQQPSLSRARWQELIKSGHVLVNGRIRKPHYRLHDQDVVESDVPPAVPVEILPEAIPLDILFEDADILVLNKPAGLVVHPAPGHDSGTLVNALLHHCHDLAGIGGERRPGMVHRLDKDTSGVLVIAKNEGAMMSLTGQFKSRKVEKEYLALVWGHPRPASGTVETLIGRSPHNRKKMSARPLSGRPAITHYKTVEKFRETSLLKVQIETGRTHQIRVHLAYKGHPVVGDHQYGRARVTPAPAVVRRQMLHAARLSFAHPRTGLKMEFLAPLPGDFLHLLDMARERTAL